MAPIDLKALRLGVTESTLRSSGEAFAFAPNGHFGDKVQYNARFPDQFGGAYAVHCRAGKSYGIEVKYPEAGINVVDARTILQSLIKSAAGEQCGHNDDDLKKGDTKDACEFYYYTKKVRAELVYAHNSQDRVRQVSVWSQ